MQIGNKGLEKVNLIIPQWTTLTFDIVHKTEEGDVIDHSNSDIHMKFESEDGSLVHDLSSRCRADSEKIRVSIEQADTGSLPIGKMNWDIIVETPFQESIRIVYGSVEIVDTYALD